MGALLFATLLVFLLPSIMSEHQEKNPYCDGGKASKVQVRQVEDPVGDLRWLLANGTQRNGPDGEMMPKPKEMKEVMWNCSLESEAINLLGEECSASSPATSDRTVLLISVTGDKQPPFVSALRFWTTELNKTPMQESAIGRDNVRYMGDRNLWEYANLARAITSRIGCAQKSCPQKGSSQKQTSKHTVLCVTDQPPLRVGDVIYEVRDD